MTITLTKTKLAVAVLAIALIAPATALAVHVFEDVADDRFYADAVEWAADEGITTGVSPTRFAPDENVTRGQNVTFLKRYHDNLVVPADAALQAGIDANAADIAANTATIATKANSADVYSQAEVDGAIAAARPMWARVQNTGALLAGSDGVSSEAYAPNPVGRYLVTFPRDVTTCAVVAQNNLNSANVASELVYNFGGEPTQVFVYFENESGTAENRPFSVIATC